MIGDGVGVWVAEVGGIGRWITEYLFCLPSYNEANLFLGLSVFGMKNRIGYELAQFSLNAYSVLLLQPIQFSVLKIQTLGE